MSAVVPHVAISRRAFEKDNKPGRRAPFAKLHPRRARVCSYWSERPIDGDWGAMDESPAGPPPGEGSALPGDSNPDPRTSRTQAGYGPR